MDGCWRGREADGISLAVMREGEEMREGIYGGEEEK